MEVERLANESPIPGLQVAGPDDLKRLLPMQVTMSYDWKSYWNQAVLEAVRGGSKRRLTHVKFMPDVENGLLYVVYAMSGDYGAVRLEYTGPETGAELSLYVPLLRFDLERDEGRQRIFPVESHAAPGGTFIALNVGKSTSVPVKKRAVQATPADEAAAGGSPTET